MLMSVPLDNKPTVVQTLLSALTTQDLMNVVVNPVLPETERIVAVSTKNKLEVAISEAQYDWKSGSIHHADNHHC